MPEFELDVTIWASISLSESTNEEIWSVDKFDKESETNLAASKSSNGPTKSQVLKNGSLSILFMGEEKRLVERKAIEQKSIEKINFILI